MLGVLSQGSIPLIVEVGSADIMASLLQLKADIEEIREFGNKVGSL